VTKRVPRAFVVILSLCVPLLIQAALVAKGEQTREGSLTSGELIVTILVGTLLLAWAFRSTPRALVIAIVVYWPLMTVLSVLWIHALLVGFFGGP
jgi:hypothetical protein